MKSRLQRLRVLAVGNKQEGLELPNHPTQDQKRQTLNRHKEAEALIEQGKVRCTGCNKISDMETAIHVWRGEQFLVSMCADCQHAGLALVCQRTERGFQVRISGPKGAILRPADAKGP